MQRQLNHSFFGSNLHHRADIYPTLLLVRIFLRRLLSLVSDRGIIINSGVQKESSHATLTTQPTMNADLKRVREASGGTGAEDGMSPSKKRALGSFTSVSSQSQGQDDDDQEDWMKELEVGAGSTDGCNKFSFLIFM